MRNYANVLCITIQKRKVFLNDHTQELKFLNLFPWQSLRFRNSNKSFVIVLQTETAKILKERDNNIKANKDYNADDQQKLLVVVNKIKNIACKTIKNKYHKKMSH